MTQVAMKTTYIRTTLKQAQANLDELCSRVVSKQEVAIIKRPAGPDVALIAAHELSGLIETIYLLKSPKNAARLLTALERTKAG